jgi:pyrimidine-nucleoside phosphorylase
MNPIEIIRKKRDGLKLTKEELEFFIQNSINKTIPEYQVSALLMAIYFKGMDHEETAVLTKLMKESGHVVQFHDSKPKVDKHSTGGVGDKISLILAPLVAACGVDVPMLAGRGLGHTGGTTDKLESIEGYNVQMNIKTFKNQVKKIGVALMGQTKDFVPADKLFYSLRDVTATVESIPLITSSILSKKAAEGIDSLVMDIKTGNGAFMSNLSDAQELGTLLILTGKKLGIKIRALITDMNQPLGFKVGNSLEVLESLETLQNKGPQDVTKLTIELAAHMLILGKKAKTLEEAKKLALSKLKDGSALKKFAQMTLAQGAKYDVTKNPERLPISKNQTSLLSLKDGYIAKMDTRKIGLLLTELGGGRKKAESNIDFSVGYHFYHKLGDLVKKNEPIVKVYYNLNTLKENGFTIKDFLHELHSCFTFSHKKITPPKLIKKVLI